MTKIVKTSSDLNKALTETVPGDILLLSEGDYVGKFTVRTPGITLKGAGRDKTRILWDDYAKREDSQGRALNTFRTYTLAVLADHVHMEDLAIVNTAGEPHIKGQEVALTVYGDHFAMERCLLSSTQDTLFVGPLPRDLVIRYEYFLEDALRQDRPLRQSFRECHIEGTIDFIFGCGAAVFDRCTLHSLRDVRPIGYVAAPSHSLAAPAGFLFRERLFTAAAGVPAASVYLARPWREYGLSAFDRCTYGPHIHPLGFDPWNNSRRDRTARFYESPLLPGRVSWARPL